MAVESVHHEIDQCLQFASFGGTRSLVFNEGCKQSTSNCLGKQEARRKDPFHLFYHPQVWRVTIDTERLLTVCSHRYGGKYCGLAEMSGPFDPDTEVNIWTEGLQGNEGVIPTRWIVAKDVEFSVFGDLTYNDKRVTTLRHANT